MTTGVDQPVVEQDLRCPLCEYNLRGLVEPRCPECGHGFDWEELRFRRDHLHPYLFEHHPEHKIWAFVRTLVSGLRPVKFWRTLRPVHHTRAPQIVGYWCAAATLAVLGWLTVWMGVLGWSGVLEFYLAFMSPMQAFIQAIEQSSGHIAMTYLLAWPWLTLATFAIFRVSLGRARVRFAHVMRCALYPGDAVVWLAPILGLVHYIPDGLIPRPLDVMLIESAALATVGLLWMALRLLIAAKVYLNFHQSVIMAMLTQVIVLGPLMIWWTAQVYFYFIMRG